MTRFTMTRAALISAAMAAAGAALPAAAQNVAVAQDPGATVAQDQTPAYDDENYIVVGAIGDPKTKAVEDAADAAIPEMPVVYETPAAAPKSAASVTAS